MPAKKVFISYNHADGKTAKKLKDKLTAKGIDVVIDSERMLGGEDIKEFIEKCVRETDITISLVSKNSLLSAWVAMESARTFSLENRDAERKFLACYITDDFFERTFTDNALDHIEEEIEKIQEIIGGRMKKDRQIRDVQNELERFTELRNNIDKIVGRLKESLGIDIRDKNLNKNFAQILEAIQSSKTEVTVLFKPLPENTSDNSGTHRGMQPETEQYVISRIKQLEKENEFLKTSNSEIEKKLAASDEARALHEKTTKELEERLNLQKGSDVLKAQAFEALERKDYNTTVKLLIESAKENIQKVAETFYELAKAETLRLNYPKSLEYYELAARIEPGNALYLHQAGFANQTMGFYDNAIKYYEKVLVIYKAENDEENSNVATCYNNLGGVYIHKGEYDKAIEYSEKALLIDKKFYGEEHRVIATRYNNLGLAYHYKSEYGKATEYYEKALLINKKFYGEEHPDIATRYNNLGGVYRHKNEYDKAIEYYQKALVIDKKFHGEEHPYIAIDYNNIGSAYDHKGEYDKATEYYEKALLIDKKLYGEEHPDIAIRYNNLGLVYNHKGEYDKAIEYYDKALLIDKKFYGEEHPQIAILYNNEGLAYYNIGENDKAIEYYEKALKIMKKLLGEYHPTYKQTMENLAFAREAKNKK